MDKKIIGIIAVVAVVGVIATRGSASKNTNTQKTELKTIQTSPEVKEKINVTQTTSEVRTIMMEAGAFYYSVKEIRVKRGDKVKVVMTSKDMMHNFNIDELNVKSVIAKTGETAEVEFTANKAGEFEYYCSVGQHRVNGQIGKLIVEE